MKTSLLFLLDLDNRSLQQEKLWIVSMIHLVQIILYDMFRFTYSSDLSIKH
jgi:uncharacterized membrane protein